VVAPAALLGGFAAISITFGREEVSVDHQLARFVEAQL
jgi:hypothetical protein